MANDDTSHVKPILDQLAQYEAAKLPVEVHLYARGAHGFGMGTRSKFASIKTWTQRMSDWLGDSGFLAAAQEKSKAGK